MKVRLSGTQMKDLETTGSRRGSRGLVKEIEYLNDSLLSHESVQLTGTHGIARSITAFGLFAFSKKPVVIVLPDIKTRDRVARDMLSISKLMGAPFALPESSRIMRFPSWELTPYMDEWIHPKVSSMRIKGLFSLMNGVHVALLTTLDALLIRLVEPEGYRSSFMILSLQMQLNRDRFLEELFLRGYTRSASAELPGDVSVRGGVIDLFSPVEEAPVRIELEGDEIATLRLFDPSTQRSTQIIDSYQISPAQEMYPQAPFTDIQRKLYSLKVSREGKKEIRRFVRALSSGDSIENRLWLSPYFFDLNTNFFSYLSRETPILIWDAEECRSNLARAYETIQRQYEKVSGSLPLFPDPEKLFLSPEEVDEEMERHPSVAFGLALTGKRALRSISSLDGGPFQPKDVKDLRQASWPDAVMVKEACRLRDEGYEIWIAEPSKKRIERFQEELMSRNMALPVLPSLDIEDNRGRYGGVVKVEIPEGVAFPNLRFAVLSRMRPWGVPFRKPKAKGEGIQISDLAMFKEGDPLVHLDYGIGVYRGLKHVDVLGKLGEFLQMEYAKGDKLFVPIDRLDRIQRYIGSGDTPPPLDTLGSTSWDRKKMRLREDVAKIARELLELYAIRKAVKGFAFGKATEGLKEFEASFPYQETPDQQRAIEDIFRDMTADMPMDRLVCGDVGFGKTEVAMRAAFKAVMEGKQVAVLVPTTVLAEQHYVNFSERFSPYPVRVELLSRFRSMATQKAVVADLAKGTVDIVIGTHRLLQRDIKFRDLGLLIIDEEHRFGVTHKEILKKLSSTVDVMTLTATPIPRTLQMSLAGLRDLSLINTPPRARLPIVTKISRFRKNIIEEGIERELSRGGQVFFVHNRVKTIPKMAQLIQELAPSAKVTFAHGQMDENALEEIMLAFMHRQIDVLVCTTIIESGVDIPNVNTLFVNHAEQFGLSTLYQLRGRIGRSDRQAYAYFLIPHRAILPKEAIKRLQSLQEFSGLGSGFKLSLMDLNMRGGGDLLGRKQSGRIAELGFELYTRIIEEEVKKLKGQWKEPRPPVDIKLPFSTFLPERYIPEMGLRLMFYRRLSNIENAGEISTIEEELRDRFGPLPLEATCLLDAVRLKVWLTGCGVSALYGKENELTVSFTNECKMDRERLVSLLQGDPKHYKLMPLQKLVIRLAMPDTLPAYADRVRSILKQFVVCDKSSESRG